MEQIREPPFWFALGEIIWVNILLSGDNAVVIAMAARSLPPAQRRRAIVGGSVAAIALRVLLTVFAVHMLQFPCLKIAGAALLFWVGVQLLVPAAEGEVGVRPPDHLWPAIRTILIADFVMSLDNVIAVAAAAESGPPASRLLLLVIGLGLSIPFIVFGSTLLLSVMERFPVIVTLGAGLLGYVAGGMLVTDSALDDLFAGAGQATTTMIEWAGAVGVVLVGRWWAGRRKLQAAPGR